MMVDLEHILLIDKPLLVPAVGHSQCDGCQLRLSTFATDFVAVECKAKYVSSCGHQHLPNPGNREESQAAGEHLQ